MKSSCVTETFPVCLATLFLCSETKTVQAWISIIYESTFDKPLCCHAAGCHLKTLALIHGVWLEAQP